jgi:SAM-dependent methyltransferase
MTRSLIPEVMDNPDVPEAALRTFHRGLDRIHGFMGNADRLIRHLRRGALPVRSVLDIGCGHGGLLAKIRRVLGVQVTGIDLRAPANDSHGVPILQADATRDLLPRADAAVAVYLVHHLSEEEIEDLVRNVGRSCKRFIILDLVRHPLPLVLFTLFICPFVHRGVAVDGRQSIRRAYSPNELRLIVERALAGTCARFEHHVSKIHAGQIVDINY